MMDPASKLRARLMPILQRWEQELRRDNPNITTKIYDWPIGRLTSWQGHDIGIECVFKNVVPEWPDNVALSISLKHLDKSPSIQSADVVWGHPSGYVEASLLPTSVEFSPNHLAEVIERLPELFTALKQAIRRGRPVA
ncbi:hypothetical protein [Bradyrhizobium diversitatis]|uniref:Uncharacterized protein n=1 Tax=Bradyrhizobium diversitatis TaxID=2755406 RepID=A0ABS0P1Q2_9BRAD|nr:hypothetical protein [Bradyrhizobium diversitatis]MBH5387196.1 hypothetical protein [Bradyrhizobium diversitatis]